MKFKRNIIFYSIIVSCLFSNNLSISMESKYGNGTKIHSETNENQGNFYYNENIMDINFNFDNGFYLYGQLEYSRPPFKGFDFVGVNNYYLEYNLDKYKIKIGDIYTLYGRGLAVNLFQDHLIDYDNSLKGLELNYYLNDYSSIFFLAGKKDFFFRTKNTEEVPNLAVENYVYMFGLDHGMDDWGFFHYLYLDEESILDYDKYPDLKQYHIMVDAHPLEELLEEDPASALDWIHKAGQDSLTTSEHNFSWDKSFFETDFYIEHSIVNYTAVNLEEHTGSKLYLSLYRDVLGFGVTYEYKDYSMEHYLKTLSNPPIVYRESTSTLASRNSHSINWNNEVGHQFNVNKYINDMINIEFNLSTASKHKEPSDNFNFLDVLFLSKGSFPSSPFRQLYLESSGFLWEDKFYYKIGFDDFYQVKGEEMSCQYINAYTIPTLFTYTMGESSFTTYFEMQNKKDKIFTIDDSDNYTLSNEQQYTGRYLSFTSTYKGKLSFTYFKEDAWQPGYSYWEGYDITSNINSTTQLSLFYGSQKGGLVCANGVCAVQPGLNDAVKITFRSLF